MARWHWSFKFDADEPATLVNPPVEVGRSLVRTAHGRDGAGTVRFLSTPARLKRLFEDWLTATRAADLAAAGTAAFRASESVESSPVVVTEAAVEVAVFGTAVETTDPDTRDAVADRVDDRWAEATPHDFDTPALSTVETTLAADFGPDARDDFLALCEAAAPLTRDGPLDERVLLVLAGARHELQNYEVGQWADYHGLSSQSMVNRTKSTMEDAGLLDTETESGHVGRPRQILVLPADLADLPDEALLDRAREALS